MFNACSGIHYVFFKILEVNKNMEGVVDDH